MINNQISKTSNIHKNAIIGENVFIGDYVYIGENVKIGNNVKIFNNVIIDGNTIINDGNQIYHYSIIGTPPQDKKYAGEKSFLYIGKNNIIREFCTIHSPTNEKKHDFETALNTKEGITYIGDNNFFMTGTHIAHNCILGSNIIMANNSALAGHCIVYDNANIGAFVIIHQFTQIGEFSMIGSGFRVAKDVIPFALAAGYDFKIMKVNSIGLRRNGFSADDINEIKKIFKILLWSNYNVSQALEKLSEINNKYSRRIIEFIKKSKRGITV
ncbi:MAG TPA: acyl-ACP--UDP-N-acetylglucosamine O-acyltransferase [bacterium]|nr:acyl-ACP--UDP-N-acetylglucosamine O-acyltransferase [bacterium]HOL48368.1 acyl-ACP--UDP-N-acetylglucosamine O-acyltransferase [bacterium]HPQ19465.1 acyl-ACP--UDP-N-acetylglucosamine O-acyltransferase [bacterium]